MSIKNFYLAVIVGLVLVIVYLRACTAHTPNLLKEIKYDTLYKQVRDTVKINVPVPFYKKDNPIIPIRIDTVWQSSTDYRISDPKIDTQAILKDYYATYYYSDTAHVQYGDIIINDNIEQNKIASRKVFTDFKIPEVVKTITTPEKKRNQIYLGLNAFGSQDNYLYMAGLSALLKTKNDKIWEVGASYSIDNKIFYSLSTKFKISFKK